MTQNININELYYESIIYTLIMHLSMIATGLYQRELTLNFKTLTTRIFISIAIGAGIYNLLASLFLINSLCFHTQLVAYTLSFGAILSVRSLIFSTSEIKSSASRVLILGTGIKALELQNEILNASNSRSSTDSNYTLLGFIDIPDINVQPLVPQDKIINLDGVNSLYQYISTHHIKEIIIALDERRNLLPTDDLIMCKLNGIKITDIADFLERESGSINLESFKPNHIIFSDGVTQHVRFKTKRLFDVIFSLVILIVTMPIMLLTAILIYMESGFKGSVLYRQVRIGLNGQPFKILKFRSMVENAEKDGNAVWASKNDTRVTKFGRFIRKARIDELPQLYNVLKGEMSLVGPRPERPEFVKDLSGSIPYYNLRHYAMPGITGWAQTNYPYGASLEDAKIKLKYELYYIKNYSIFLDLLILFQTVSVVLWGKGAR
ncbi:MAG: sugar transferase (PEP-CTERM system associated) [Gammaproteobacteria bacterium]|jgi:sugar transferase (PEP-CTERM system associated)